ncbi:MAG: ribosome assembly RNA-binding protein YhbY [Desulfobulbaceae bacterium]|nr:ribosome assembly RNA-binding protein YhbY [Desulfobulbaceae bacterium]
MDKKPKLPELTGRQKKYLRGLGHHLEHMVIVGREGLTGNLIASCNDAILAHELIKIKLGQNCPLEKKAAAEELAKKTGSHQVQLIGKTVLLYRPNPDKPRDERLQLPAGK